MAKDKRMQFMARSPRGAEEVLTRLVVAGFGTSAWSTSQEMISAAVGYLMAGNTRELWITFSQSNMRVYLRSSMDDGVTVVEHAMAFLAYADVPGYNDQ